MIFIKTSDLTPGMCLARDVNFYEPNIRFAVSLRSGQKLTDVHITQMTTANIDGVYIDNIRSEIRIVSSINSEIKNQAISDMHNLADNFIDDSKGIQKSDIDNISSTTEKLLDSLANKKDILINIADLKMYDDYTFHHSLSVSIMATAIGIELGLDKQCLFEIGLAGLLHDIGKVMIPIEIINKPSKLTPEEFEIVKMHPVYAANHLRERKLVSENCYQAIIQHHEKFNGTGYPYGIKDKNIHPYARILAIADVYDALTSARPYRNPSPPNEVVEYIMGGSGSHFDVDFVSAFLRKVAPFPVGSKVCLSDGTTAMVIKNFPEQPLRPLLSKYSDGRVYDLAHDSKYLNLVITGLFVNTPSA